MEPALQFLIQIWLMPTLHLRPPKCCHAEPTHGPSSFPLVTTKIDKVAGINYSLVAAPRATANNLDWQLKVRLTPRDIYPQAFVLDPPGLRLILISALSPCSRHTGLPLLLNHPMHARSPGPLHLLLLLPRSSHPDIHIGSPFHLSRLYSNLPLPRETFPDHTH